MTTNGVTYNYVLVQLGQNWILQSLVASQIITFPAQPGQSSVAGGTFPLNPPATASSGLAVAHTSTTPSVCTIVGTNVSGVSVGMCTIAANQADNANFTAAPQVTQNILIGPAPQTITFAAQPAHTFVAGGTFVLNPPATASSGLPVTYVFASPSVCTISGITVTIVSSGSCVVTTSQAGNANFTAAAPVTQPIAIGQSTQTINFGAQLGQTFVAGGTFPLNPAATASSGLAVTYTSTSSSVCSITGTTVTIISVGTCSIAANQAGNANVAAAPQVVKTIAIGPALQSITFDVQANQTFAAGSTFTLNPVATASSGLPVTYTVTTPSVCSILNTTVTMIGSGVCSVTATQAGHANFAAASPVGQPITLTVSGTAATGAVPAPALGMFAMLALITLLSAAVWLMERSSRPD